MRRQHQNERILAIDPTTKGFAFAVLESPNILVEWGTVRVDAPKNGNVLLRVDRLIDCFAPTLIVVEDCVVSGSRRRDRIRTLIAAITSLATRRRIRVRRVARDQVRRSFETTGRTKYAIALEISRRFPELQPRVPRLRRLWMSEDERMNIFDALSLALALDDAA